MRAVWAWASPRQGARGSLVALPPLEHRAGGWGLGLQQPLRGPPPRLLPSPAEPAGCAVPGGPPSTKAGHWRPLLPRSLLEESFVTKDPFTPDKDRFLVLGSRCSVCSRLECSLFYSKRFCLPCVQENVHAFPQEIRHDLEKRKVPSKRPASQPSTQA
ncbi:hypothetical protein HJG60_010023 [Phyllostomus discolor]|uniref:Cysteine-rich DPF motif domain-containing protein 1 n=1 Tax=Phyllostomus discolor TaxID=89673 RepID=A0A834AVY9_9CHIR|nr:hypothetical protein HJG60_010023 [Phyllostomus discolor]